MSYSSAAYRAVSHPIHLPVKPYWVYGADALTQKLVRLVARLRPGADCLGVIGPDQELPAPQGAGFVLITDADWEERARRLSGAGWSAEQVMVLPLAVDCPSSGFSRFLNEMSDLVDVSDGPDRVHLPQDMATTILMREGIAKLEGGRIGISSTLYPSVHEPNRLKQGAGDIRRVHDALANERSRSAYLSVLRDPPHARLDAFVGTMLRGQQYFEHVRISPGDTVLNFGVFDGFEIPGFAALMHGEGRLINIDPLGHTYLSRYVRDAIDQYEGLVELFPYCVTDQDGETDFLQYDDGQAASHAHAMKAEAKARSGKPLPVYPTRKLSTLIGEIAPERIDLMKFDVEGAEEMLIDDLPEIVARYRPQIALSVYHATRHLWEMPLQMMAMCENYEFRFGSYSMTRYESILYCLPRG
ncbi:MAG: FkbM family methyltransferase [Nisaea sp.]|uniref:FkbM family methyltransferase n=1 Tax=Nisaea sp. TaxID=2024842 RepID=UPI001B1F6FC0|nr:FkbM family methyltransferase [Nisaea sp.]MBO6562081.1 FkbM family methyltransferase [Nisaea sp.]